MNRGWRYLVTTLGTVDQRHARHLQTGHGVELRGVGQCLNLKHPNLVVVQDILKAEDDDAWIVMEYVAGGSLEQLLAREEPCRSGPTCKAANGAMSRASSAACCWWDSSC